MILHSLLLDRLEVFEDKRKIQIGSFRRTVFQWVIDIVRERELHDYAIRFLSAHETTAVYSQRLELQHLCNYSNALALFLRTANRPKRSYWNGKPSVR